MQGDMVIKLIDLNGTILDEDGNDRPNRSEREVFARRRSIGAKEFFEAGQQKLKPAFVLIVFTYDYQGEELVEVDGKEYTIYRSYALDDPDRGAPYPVGERVELYCEERVNNG